MAIWNPTLFDHPPFADVAGSEIVTPPTPPVDQSLAVPLFCHPFYSDRLSYRPIASFSGGNWRASAPVTNLQDARFSRVARTTNLDPSSTFFDIDLAAACSVGACVIPKHNMTTSATMAWVASNVAPGGYEAYTTGGYIPVWPNGATRENTAGLNVAATHYPVTPITARYWRCYLVDNANLDGYVQLGRAFVAGIWESKAMLEGAALTLDDLTERTVTDGSSALYNVKPVSRRWQFTLTYLDDETAMTRPFQQQHQLGLSGQLFFAMRRGDIWQAKRSFTCTMGKLNGIAYPYATYSRAAYELAEVL